jgi:hypothetical protein
MKYAVGLLVVLLAASSFASQSEEQYRTQFTEFMRQYNKVYSHDEFPARYNIFKTNVDASLLTTPSPMSPTSWP